MSKKKTFYRGYKFKIYPTEEQKEKINDLVNYFRYVYNWAIAKEKEIYEQNKQGLSEYQFYSYFDLDELFRKERDTNPKMAWIKEKKFPLATAREALKNVYHGYEMFFDGVNEGVPTFKKKNKCKKSFNTRNDRFKIHNTGIKLEGMHDSYIDLGFDCGLNLNKAVNPTITIDNIGDYYVSFNIKEECKELNIPKTEPIGIDLGIRQTFALSTGEIFNQPKKSISKYERRLRKQERLVTRDKKRRLKEANRTKTKYEDIPESKRAKKRRIRLNKLYKKIHNIKNTFYHTITKQIVMRNPQFVCMETFSVRSIQKNEPWMNDKLCTVSFYDITQKMKYKCEEHGITFIQVPTEFASTKTCSNCGSIKDMRGKYTYKCPICGMVEDRDINAAINLRNFGLVH